MLLIQKQHSQEGKKWVQSFYFTDGKTVAQKAERLLPRPCPWLPWFPRCPRSGRQRGGWLPKKVVDSDPEAPEEPELSLPPPPQGRELGLMSSSHC